MNRAYDRRKEDERVITLEFLGKDHEKRIEELENIAVTLKKELHEFNLIMLKFLWIGIGVRYTLMAAVAAFIIKEFGIVVALKGIFAAIFG